MQIYFNQMEVFAENICIFVAVDNVMSHHLTQLHLGDPMKVRFFYYLNYISTDAQNFMYLICKSCILVNINPS